MVVVSMNLKEEVPANIVKWARLEKTVNDMFDTFEAGEQRNAELINRFFDQPIFYWEESLIDKLIEVKADIKFNDIKNEWINLATLLYDGKWMWDFYDCINKIGNIGIKRAFVNGIYSKVRSKIWAPAAPYNDFDAKCAIPLNANVVEYFHTIARYLEWKEWASGSAKKAIEILKEINITNEDLNNELPAGIQIPAWVNLSDSAIPANTKKDFDTLLSFEIGKEADRTISIAKDFSKTYQSLLTNSIPAINTVVWENDEYKYDEEKLIGKYPEYQTKLQEITNDTNLSEVEKKDKIKWLKREFYLKYLKTKNSKIWNALEELYNNDFDYSKVDKNTLKDYFDNVVDLRLKMLVDKWINEFLSLNWGNFDEFKAFYKELTNVDPAHPVLNLTLSSVNIPWATPPAPLTGNENLPIRRKLVEWPNHWLKDIDEFWKNAEKPYDVFPMEFTINKADIEALNITIEDKMKLLNFLARFDQWDRYEIKWADIWNLIYLFFVINSKLPITEFKAEEQKKIEELFWQAKNREHKEWENGEESWKEDWEESDKAIERYLPEKFKEEIEKKWPWKFENGSEIWLPMCESELPGWWYWWMKVKISNVDMKKWTFKWTVHWWELNFDSKLEWKSREFQMNKKTLEEFDNISKDSNKVWLLPNPDKSDFNSFRDKLGDKLWNEELSFPPAWTTWNENKFIQKIINKDWKEKEMEVKYFWAKSDDKSVYKVEYNPVRRNFTISSSFNSDEKWKDWKSEKKRFSYKRDMDWNNFLIFSSQKWLTPQTEEEAKNAVARQDKDFKMANGGSWKINWFSFNNIKNWLKDIFWAIKKKIDDYNKAQTEKFKSIVEPSILKAIWAIPLLPSSIKNAIWERQQEIYNEELNGAWNEIEKYLKALQSDGQFADTFDQVPPHVQTLYGKSYQKFITDLFKKWNPSKEESRKAAALLLANFEKWWSPFRGLSEFENKWLWVKVLLWEAHYQQFLRDKAACIRDRDLAEKSGSEEDKKWLNEQLATCEMDYIINNVRWAIPKLPGSYFPSHENRWIDWDKSTNYIPNPSKRLLSETFANKLEDAKKWRFTKSSVEDTYSKNKSINRFAIMEDEFSKCGSSRYRQGAWALRRMFDLASSESLKKRSHKHFLTYLLSWVLDVNCDPWLKKQVYGRAKPMSFVPWMLVKEAWVAENIAILLDDATNWDFSKHVTKYFRKDGQLRWWIDFKWLQWEINTWLTDEKMNELNDYFAKLPTNDFLDVKDSHKKQILEKFKKSLLDEDVEEFDRWLLENPTIVNNGLLTNINVVSDRLKFEDGEFKWKDSDDISNKRRFRNDVAKAIKARNYHDPKDVNFVLDKYLSWFWLRSSENRQNIYKWINTAYHYQKMVNESGGTYQCSHQWKNENWKNFDFPLWTITQKDVDKVLLYAFEWKVWERLWWAILPAELKEALDAFQNFFNDAFKEWSLKDNYVKSQAFRSWTLWDDDQFLLWWWDAYKKIREKEISNSNDIDDAESIDDLKDLKRGQKREITRRIFNDDDNYINPEMESMYKTLKRRNSLDEKWKLSISSDTQVRIIDLQKKLNSSKKTPNGKIIPLRSWWTSGKKAA